MHQAICPSKFANNGNAVQEKQLSTGLKVKSNTTATKVSPGRARLKSAAFTQVRQTTQISGRAMKNRSIEVPAGFHSKKDSEKYDQTFGSLQNQDEIETRNLEETQNLHERQTVLSKTKDGPPYNNSDVYEDLKSAQEYTPELEKLLLSGH